MKGQWARAAPALHTHRSCTASAPLLRRFRDAHALQCETGVREQLIILSMKVILRHKDLHAYGKICESVHKTASANKLASAREAL